MNQLYAAVPDNPQDMFVTSTIFLEGAVRWIKTSQPDLLQTSAIGCFDWDPLAELLSDNILMVRQDVPAMLDMLWDVIAQDNREQWLYQIPPMPFGG